MPTSTPFRLSIFVLVLALSLGLFACGTKVKQNIKNNAYSLNSAWSTVSQKLQKTQSKLLIAEQQLDDNSEAINDSTNITAKLDSAGWVNLERYKLNVKQQESKFNRMKMQADSLQKIYESQHEAYNVFLSKVDKNAIGNEEARSKVENFKDKQAELATDVSLISKRYEKAVREYNSAVAKLKSTTKNYRLKQLPENTGANIE